MNMNENKTITIDSKDIIIFPVVIGDIEFCTKDGLFDWVKTQQETIKALRCIKNNPELF